MAMDKGPKGPTINDHRRASGLPPLPLSGLNADNYPVKLVRDKMLDKIGDGKLTYERLEKGGEQHVKLLRGKLVEETVEYLLDPSLGELADVAQAVLDLVAVDLGFTPIELESERVRKEAERGGFTEGTIMLAHVREVEPQVLMVTRPMTDADIEELKEEFEAESALPPSLLAVDEGEKRTPWKRPGLWRRFWDGFWNTLDRVGRGF